jgi:hypothetical protein
MRKWILILVLFLIALFIAYKYVFQNHRDIQTEKSSYITSAAELAREFEINSIDSESKYLDKTIQISGNISEFNEQSITLDNTVFCLFSEPQEPLFKLNTKVLIKGRFIGYDDLLEQIKIDQCYIIN